VKVKQIIALSMDVVIFGRVSTLIQDYDRQINELTAICTQRGWLVRSVFTEKISGAKKNAERKELSRMIEYIKAQHIDKVLVTELSRLGRDTLQVLQVIETLNDMKVSLYIQNYNIETLNEDGKVNAMSQFLITILAEIARMERKTIRERMNSGYKNFREQGGVVGRKQGYTKSEDQMKQQYSQEIKLLRKGLSLREVSKLTGHSINTIRKVIRFV
jgi:DNA invertase Pin-like site-specific DNA recombinase